MVEIVGIRKLGAKGVCTACWRDKCHAAKLPGAIERAQEVAQRLRCSEVSDGGEGRGMSGHAILFSSDDSEPGDDDGQRRPRE